MRRFASLFVLALVAVDPVVAQELSKQKTLSETQAQLLSASSNAWIALDFDRSLQVLQTLRDITTSRRAEPKHIGVPEIDFMLRDVEKIRILSPEQRDVAAKHMHEKVRGSNCNAVADHHAARVHHKKSLELARSIFDEGSYFVTDAQFRVAGSLLASGNEEAYAEGVDIALGVRRVLEKEGMTNFLCYRELLDILTRLYFKQKDFSSAIEVGEITVKLYHDHGAHQTGASALLSSVVAECYNQVGQHEKALAHAGRGLSNNPPLDGVYGVACTRLLQEYARARIALGSSTDVARTFEKLLTVSDQFAAAGYFPLDKRLEYRDEYLAFLEEEGSTERAEEVRKEIDRLKLRAPLQKSRYSD